MTTMSQWMETLADVVLKLQCYVHPYVYTRVRASFQLFSILYNSYAIYSSKRERLQNIGV